MSHPTDSARSTTYALSSYAAWRFIQALGRSS